MVTSRSRHSESPAPAPSSCGSLDLRGSSQFSFPGPLHWFFDDEVAVLRAGGLRRAPRKCLDYQTELRRAARRTRGQKKAFIANGISDVQVPGRENAAS